MTLARWPCYTQRVGTLKRRTVILLACLAVTLAGCTGSAEFEVTALTVAAETILAGEGATVTALITNTGASAGSYTAVLNVDGASAETRTVTVPAESTAEVQFAVEELSPGTYVISIGEAEAALTVLSIDDLLRKSQQAISRVKSYHMTVEIDLTIDSSTLLTLEEE